MIRSVSLALLLSAVVGGAMAQTHPTRDPAAAAAIQEAKEAEAEANRTGAPAIPPRNQNAILPSAGLHERSAAPTMQRSYPAAPTSPTTGSPQ